MRDPRATVTAVNDTDGATVQVRRPDGTVDRFSFDLAGDRLPGGEMFLEGWAMWHALEALCLLQSSEPESEDLTRAAALSCDILAAVREGVTWREYQRRIAGTAKGQSASEAFRVYAWTLVAGALRRDNP